MIFFCFFFGNGYFHNVVSTLINFIKLDVEKDNVVSTLFNVVHINVDIRNVDSTLFGIANWNDEIHNVVSKLIWPCPTSWRHINQKITLKQRWNVCWDKFENSGQHRPELQQFNVVLNEKIIKINNQFLQRSRKNINLKIKKTMSLKGNWIFS